MNDPTPSPVAETCGYPEGTLHLHNDRCYQAGLVAGRGQDRMRGTGGNHFIPAAATSADLLRSINDQLGDLREWVAGTDRFLDLAEVTISTQRISSGLISVSVTADLGHNEEGQ